MAEEKPKDSSGGSSDPLVEIVSLFLIFFVLISFLNSVVDSFRLNSLFSKGLKGFSKNELILQNTRPLNSALNKLNLNVSKTKLTLYNPLFLLSYILCLMISIFKRNLGWEEIKHNKKLAD
jgi:hypothetical protein